MAATGHWAEQYVGIPYSQLNCAQLVAHALRTHFDRDDIALTLEGYPQHGEGTQERSAAIHGHRGDVATRAAEACDGCGVVLQVGNRLQHMGLLAVIQGRTYILHTTAKAGAVLQPIDRVARVYTIEGFYQWKNK